MIQREPLFPEVFCKTKKLKKLRFTFSEYFKRLNKIFRKKRYYVHFIIPISDSFLSLCQP